MAKQYQMRSPGICLSGSKPPTLPDLSIPASHYPNWHIRTNMHTPSTTPTPKFEWPSSTEPVCSVSASRSQKRPSCPISAARPPTTATHIFKPTYILPQRAPPCIFDGQTVPSAFARYLPLGVTTTSPPISASLLPTASINVSDPTYMFSLQPPPRNPSGQAVTNCVRSALSLRVPSSISPEAENGELGIARDLLVCAWAVADTERVCCVLCCGGPCIDFSIIQI